MSEPKYYWAKIDLTHRLISFNSLYEQKVVDGQTVSTYETNWLEPIPAEYVITPPMVNDFSLAKYEVKYRVFSNIAASDDDDGIIVTSNYGSQIIYSARLEKTD